MPGYDKQIVQNDQNRWKNEACDESGCVIAGVGPEAPIVVNSKGGKQSRSRHRCDLLPARATLYVAEVLEQGAAKYGPNNWRSIPCEDHINHALVHLFSYLAGDRQDSHLEHAACRALMALEMKDVAI